MDLQVFVQVPSQTLCTVKSSVISYFFPRVIFDEIFATVCSCWLAVTLIVPLPVAMTVLPPAIFVLLFDDDCREPLSALLVVVLPDNKNKSIIGLLWY